MPRIFLSITLLLIINFSSGFTLAEGRLIDNGQGIFFSNELGSKLTDYKEFPITWWNFLVWDLGETPNSEKWEKLGELCQTLKDRHGSLIERLECQQDITQYKEILRDWARDYPLRHQLANEEEFKRVLTKSLAKASLPTPSEMLALIRQDPFQTYNELNQLVSEKAGINLGRSEGFFFDPTLNRVVLPVQFNFPPERDHLTKKFTQTFSTVCKKGGLCTRWVLLGPHGSTVENKDQIMSDVSRVSTVGIIVLTIFSLFLIKIKRGRLLLLIPPVLISFCLTVIITILCFSSIHGLTMAFGIGNIGLSLDYGFHAAFNVKKKNIWKSNLFGFLTTGIVLFILSFSKIPLFQQLMFFSLCGLAIAFLIFWLMFRFLPGWFKVDPLPIHPIPSKYKAILVSVIFIGGLFVSIGHSPNLDMSAMDFQSEAQKVFRKWVYEKINKKNPLFEINAYSQNQNPLTLSHQRLKWAKANSITIETAALYLPTEQKQRQNLATWRQVFCSQNGEGLNLTSIERKFFAPFLSEINCQSLKNRELNIEKLPSYMSDFYSQGKEISFWFPKDNKEKEKIIRAFPQVNSLIDLSNIFPKTLFRELKWMLPLSLSLITLILLLYYRRFSFALISLLPFLTAFGLVFLSYYLIRLEFSFVGLIAMLMVCGISVDYGIFATDISRGGEKRGQNGVWSALLFAAVTSITGFIPLIFSKHPVLIQLGQTLSIGVAGTILGSFWGIPYFIKKFYKGPLES